MLRDALGSEIKKGQMVRNEIGMKGEVTGWDTRGRLDVRRMEDGLTVVWAAERVVGV